MLHNCLFEARPAHRNLPRLLVSAPWSCPVWSLHLSLLFSARLRLLENTISISHGRNTKFVRFRNIGGLLARERVVGLLAILGGTWAFSVQAR
jgi:hypothetical protein